MKLLMMPNGVWDKTNTRQMELKDMYDLIKCEYSDQFFAAFQSTLKKNSLVLKEFVKKFDKNIEKDEYKRLKNALPAYLAGGSNFDTNSKNKAIKTSDITELSGYYMVDFDAEEGFDPQSDEFKQQLYDLPEARIVHNSPSGVRMIIEYYVQDEAIDKKDFVGVFSLLTEKILERYKELFDVNIDEQCKNVDRKGYIFYDENAYYSEAGQPFVVHKEWVQEKKEERKVREKFDGWYDHAIKKTDNRDNMEIIRDIIEWQHNEGISIVNDYSDWFSVMMAIKASVLSNVEGRDLFINISRTSFKFNEQECINKWDKNSYEQNRSKRITIGTLLWIANKYGYEVKNTGRGRVKKEIFDAYLVQRMEQHRCYLRYNVRSRKLEHWNKNKWEMYNEVWYVNFYMNILNGHLAKDKAYDFGVFVSQKYDHVEEFRKRIEKWDGEDHLSKLLETITLRNINHKPLVKIYLDKWFMGAVQTLFGYAGQNYNENILVLIGPQFVGKSRWVRTLLPGEFRNYFAECNITPKNKDDQILAAEKFIIFMDEMSQVINSKASNEDIKNFVSQTKFSVRPAYGRANEDFEKTASFVASSNEDKLLTDLTGSRRYWIVDTIKLDHNHDIDMYQVWAQAYHYRMVEKRDHWLTEKQYNIMSQFNVQYEKVSGDEELLSLYLAPSFEENNYKILNSTEVIQYINDKAGAHTIPISKANHIGRILKKNGYELVRYRDKDDANIPKKGYKVKFV